MKMLRHYRAYTGPLYRILVWGVFPILIILIGIVIGFILQTHGDELLFSVIPTALVVLLEIFSDLYCFRGLLSRKASGVTWICTSTKGITFTRDAILINELRRLFFLWISTIPIRVFLDKGFDAGIWLSVTGTAYIILWIAGSVTKLINLVGIIFSAAVIGFWCTVGLLMVVITFGIPFYISLPIALLLLLIRVASSVRKMGRFYYDK